MSEETGRLRYASLLTILVACALLLTARIIYLFLADTQRFPITTVKIAASYQHVSRQELESVLSNYLGASFFSLPVRRLKSDLDALDWTDHVYIERIWPGTLKVTLVEKSPVAVWNNALMTENGELFNEGKQHEETDLPQLSGPASQQMDVLQIYQKLSKLLRTHGLHVASLQLRDNQAWEVSLTNGIRLQLGKRDLEARLLRFCRVYPIIIADKPEQLASVDLRYAHGMAVRWKGAPK
jgi:cell division protein FtsQ